MLGEKSVGVARGEQRGGKKQKVHIGICASNGVRRMAWPQRKRKEVDINVLKRSMPLNRRWGGIWQDQIGASGEKRGGGGGGWGGGGGGGGIISRNSKRIKGGGKLQVEEKPYQGDFLERTTIKRKLSRGSSPKLGNLKNNLRIA